MQKHMKTLALKDVKKFLELGVHRNTVLVYF